MCSYIFLLVSNTAIFVEYPRTIGVYVSDYTPTAAVFTMLIILVAGQILSILCLKEGRRKETKNLCSRLQLVSLRTGFSRKVNLAKLGKFNWPTLWNIQAFNSGGLF